MTTFHRALLAMLFAAWLAMPSVGDEGGDNASGGGVWILPCAAVVDEAALTGSGGSQRAQLASHSVAEELRVQVASNMGTPSAVLVSALSADPLPLDVDGSIVHISRSLLQVLSLGRTPARIVIVDASQRGYIIELGFDSTTGNAKLSVR